MRPVARDLDLAVAASRPAPRALPRAPSSASTASTAPLRVRVLDLATTTTMPRQALRPRPRRSSAPPRDVAHTLATSPGLAPKPRAVRDAGSGHGRPEARDVHVRAQEP